MKRITNNQAALERVCPGFSLIEMIGVLAVVLLLALALAWVSTKSLDTVASNQEGANLQNFSTAFQNSILRNRYIPGSTDWYQIIATELGVNTNAVLQTDRRVTRVVMIDPNFQIGTNSTGALPYSQTTSGSTNQPQSTRVMILSSLSAALPASGTSSTNFVTLWNTTDGFLPTNGSFTGWKGRSDDLKIQRINLGSLFARLRLGNYLSSTNQGRYKIDGQGPTTVTTNDVDSWFIQNTVLSLIPDATSGNDPQAELMLTRDLSFFYVARVWRDVPYVPDYVGPLQYNPSAAGLASMIAIAASMFVNSPYNTNASAGATPPSALNTMSNFMYNYIPYAAWAATNNWPSTGTLYTAAKNAQTALYNSLNSLQNNISPSACTNGPTQ